MFYHYAIVALILFGVGLMGVLLRRNMIVVLLSIELMLNSTNVLFVASQRYLAAEGGRLFVFFVLTVSAAEVAVGLALVVLMYRTLGTINVDDVSEMKF